MCVCVDIYIYILAQVKYSIARTEPKIQPPWENKHKVRGNQEIIPIWDLTFHVTTKLQNSSKT